MTRYAIETKQYSGVWMESDRVGVPRSRARAVAMTHTENMKYACPKRVINLDTGEVLATIGETEEWEKFAKLMRKIDRNT